MKTKIKHPSRLDNNIQFGNIKIGEFFEYNGISYMKIGSKNEKK